jgi:hypothetical protein
MMFYLVKTILIIAALVLIFLAGWIAYRLLRRYGVHLGRAFRYIGRAVLRLCREFTFYVITVILTSTLIVGIIWSAFLGCLSIFLLMILFLGRSRMKKENKKAKKNNAFIRGKVKKGKTVRDIGLMTGVLRTCRSNYYWTIPTASLFILWAAYGIGG